MFKNIISVIYLMFYFLLESLLIGIILYVAWITIIPKFNINIDLTYLNCTIIIWLYKLIKFNVFNFIKL